MTINDSCDISTFKTWDFQGEHVILSSPTALGLEHWGFHRDVGHLRVSHVRMENFKTEIGSAKIMFQRKEKAGLSRSKGQSFPLRGRVPSKEKKERQISSVSIASDEQIDVFQEHSFLTEASYRIVSKEDFSLWEEDPSLEEKEKSSFSRIAMSLSGTLCLLTGMLYAHTAYSLPMLPCQTDTVPFKEGTHLLEEFIFCRGYWDTCNKRNVYQCFVLKAGSRLFFWKNVVSTQIHIALVETRCILLKNVDFCTGIWFSSHFSRKASYGKTLISSVLQLATSFKKRFRVD